jgi:hypothetical protein
MGWEKIGRSAASEQQRGPWRTSYRRGEARWSRSEANLPKTTVGSQLAVTKRGAGLLREQDDLTHHASIDAAQAHHPALALFYLATLTIPAQSQSQFPAVAKSDAECRLSKNGEVVYNDDSTLKKTASEGRENFVVKFDNGKIFHFSGSNRQNLRIEDEGEGEGEGEGDFANASNVLVEDKGSKGSSAGMMATALINSPSKLAPPPVVALTAAEKMA